MAATIFIALIYFLLFNVLRSHTNQFFIQEIKEYHYLSGIGGKGIISHQRHFTGISKVSEFVATHEMADYEIKDTTENSFHNLQVVKTW